MIKSFGSKETLKIWNGERSKRLPSEIQEIARRKLRMIQASETINDLRIPPANRLEKLTGSEFYVFGLMINGVLFLNGLMDQRKRLKL